MFEIFGIISRPLASWVTIRFLFTLRLNPTTTTTLTQPYPALTNKPPKPPKPALLSKPALPPYPP